LASSKDREGQKVGPSFLKKAERQELLAGFVLFSFQAFVLFFLSYISFFSVSSFLRFLGAFFLLLKIFFFCVFLFFLDEESLSLVDFFLGALLSFVLFNCLLLAAHRSS
jgi:hypothetical protein